MKLYKKVGSRYKEVGEEFFGFPSDGIWLVTDGTHSSSCIAKISDIPKLPNESIKFRILYRDYITNYIHTHINDDQKYSLQDLADLACDGLSVMLEGEKNAEN